MSKKMTTLKLFKNMSKKIKNLSKKMTSLINMSKKS